MIDYIIAVNPDYRSLKKAKDFLEDGKIIALPTDTSWVLASSPYSKKGVDLLYQVKKASKYKHFSILCNTISQASEYAIIDDWIFKQIKKVVPGPYTFILKPQKNLPKTIRQYKEIGIRLSSTPLPKNIIDYLGYPLITSSISGETVGQTFETPLYGDLINDTLPYVSLVLDPGEFELMGPSSVIDFTGPIKKAIILRIGAGDVSYFQ